MSRPPAPPSGSRPRLLDADGVPRLTVFSRAGSAAGALLRDRLDALRVPFVLVDPDVDPAAARYLDGIPGGPLPLPLLASGAEVVLAPDPDLRTIDASAAAAFPELALERPRLSPIRLGPDDPPVEPPVTVAGRPGRRLVAALAHPPGCLACAAYAERLAACGDDLGAAGAVAVVVARGGPADPAGTWVRRTLERLVAADGAPGSLIRFVDDGVALLVVDRGGRVVRAAAGPEAGHLPDPATVAEIVTLMDADAAATSLDDRESAGARAGTFRDERDPDRDPDGPGR